MGGLKKSKTHAQLAEDGEMVNRRGKREGIVGNVGTVFLSHFADRA